MSEPTSSDGVPAEVLRRRKLFDRLREEVRRLKPDTTGLDEEFTEAEMIETLTRLEQMLERAEVVKLAREYCDRIEHEARTTAWPDDFPKR